MSVYRYDYIPAKSKRAKNYSNKYFNIDYIHGIHLTGEKTIIGRYCNIDDKEFDLIGSFKSKCPS